MPKQKITLGSNGVVEFTRMRGVPTRTSRRVSQATKLQKLHKLLKDQTPSICVVRGEGIGDVLMTTPLIHALKKSFQDVEITYATNTRYLGGALVKALRHNPDISAIIERDLIEDLAFDLVINLQCPAMAHEKPGKIPPNRIDLFAQHAGIPLVDSKPRFFIQKEEIEAGRTLLQRALVTRKKLVLVQPFSSSSSRNDMHDKLKKACIELAKDDIVPVVITHSSDLKSNVHWNNLPNSLYFKDLDIRQIAGLAVHCDLVLCPDSSVLHLAGCLDVPCVGIFGPTPPESRINHYPQCTAVWRGADIPACPCWYTHCQLGKPCWSRMTVEDLVLACKNHLNNTSKVDINRLQSGIVSSEIRTEVV